MTRDEIKARLGQLLRGTAMQGEDVRLESLAGAVGEWIAAAVGAEREAIATQVAEQLGQEDPTGNVAAAIRARK